MLARMRVNLRIDFLTDSTDDTDFYVADGNYI